jgi:hypothetical protein
MHAIGRRMGGVLIGRPLLRTMRPRVTSENHSNEVRRKPRQARSLVTLPQPLSSLKETPAVVLADLAGLSRGGWRGAGWRAQRRSRRG